MKNGRATAESSILLDYIDPIQPVALWNSIQEKHWDVSAAISISLLLKLLVRHVSRNLDSKLIDPLQIVFSTGLFANAPTVVSDGSVGIVATSNVPETFDYFKNSAIDNSAVYTYESIVGHGAPFPPGTNEIEATQTFRNASYMGSNTTLSAEVIAIQASCDCEPVKFTYSYNNTNAWLHINITDTPCISGSVRWGSQTSINRLRKFAGLYVSPLCIDYESPHVLTGFAELAVTNASRTVANIQVVGCRLGHTVYKRKLTYNTKHGLINTGLGSVLESPPGILQDPSRIDKWILSNFTSATKKFSSEFAEEELLELMKQKYGTWDDVLDPESYSRHVEAVYRGLVTQVLAKYIFSKSNDVLIGSAETIELRLHVQYISAVALEIGFLMITLLVGFLYLYRPTDSVSRDPNIIAGLAVILSFCTDFKCFCEGTGHCNERAMRHYFYSRRYWSSPSSSHRGNFQISSEVEKEGHLPARPHTSNFTQAPKMWQPFAFTIFGRVVSLGLGTFTIAALGIIQRYSDRHKGIAEQLQDKLLQQILSQYIPASIMLLVSTLFSAADFAASLLAPFFTLERKEGRCNQALFWNLLSGWPPLSFLRSCRQRQIDTTVLSLGAFIGAVLSIFVSGLYTLERPEYRRDIRIQRFDHFNLSWTESVDKLNGTDVFFSALQFSNLSFPAFTYDNLVFPTLEVPDLFTQLTSNVSSGPAHLVSNSRIEMEIPALQPSLSCAIVTNATFDYDSIPIDIPNIEFRYQPPLRCEDSENVEHKWSFSRPYAKYPNQTVDYETYGSQMIDFGCSGLMFGFGSFNWNKKKYLSNWTAFQCNQTIREVMTRLVLKLPLLDIDFSAPPRVTDGPVHFLDNGTAGVINRKYYLTGLHTLQDLPSQSNEDLKYKYMDKFFQGVVFGINGTPAAELVGPANDYRLLDAINNFYGQYMVQAISRNMREPLEKGTGIKSPDPSRSIGNHDTNTSYPVTLFYQGSPRMVQNRTSTRILQALIGAMVICGVLAYIFGAKKGILTHKPTSIAGLATLIAGSKFCEEVSKIEGVEFMSDEELQQHELFKDQKYVLGWLGGVKSGGVRFGIDIQRPDEDEDGNGGGSVNIE